MTTQKWEDPETPAAQPVNVQSGCCDRRDPAVHYIVLCTLCLFLFCI